MLIVAVAPFLTPNESIPASRSVGEMSDFAKQRVKDFKEFDPNTADVGERPIIDAASDCLDRQEKGMALLVAQSGRSFLKFDADRRIWVVIFCLPGGFEDDPHTSMHTVEVDENLNCNWKGFVY